MSDQMIAYPSCGQDRLAQIKISLPLLETQRQIVERSGQANASVGGRTAPQGQSRKADW